MTTYLLDTPVWYWYVTGSASLPSWLKEAIEAQPTACRLSPVSVWELARLVESRRLQLPKPLGEWLIDVRERLRLTGVPLTTEAVLRSRDVAAEGADETDRLLLGTALAQGLTFLTADPKLLAATGLPILKPAPQPSSDVAAGPRAGRPGPVPAAPEPEAVRPEPTPAAVTPVPTVAAPVPAQPPAWKPPVLTLVPPVPAREDSPEPPFPPPSRAGGARAPVLRAIPQHPVEITAATFRSLGLAEPILASLDRIGFTHPTPIQAAVIPPALAGQDLIGLAQTGSGKTAAFCLPLAEKLTHGHGLRGLILSPTREIALQTQGFLDVFGEDHRLKTVCLIGGVRMGPQIDGLRAQPDIVVATPGRLLDHLRRRNLSLSRLSELIFDEADHMLDLGFMPQIQDILTFLPRERHTMMFSATMPEPIERLTRTLLKEPVRIDLVPEGRTAEGITHRLYLVHPEDKKACLIALLNQELGSTLVFIRRKVDAEWLAKILMKEGHPVERIHSDLSQGQRVDALQGFREGEHRILVATDIAARGLDIPRTQHIINFDLPETVEDYIHRAGRTARGRLKGTVSSISTWQDKAMIREIEDALGKELPRCTLPGVKPWEERGAERATGRRRLPLRRRL